jgi:hypothetical protein
VIGEGMTFSEEEKVTAKKATHVFIQQFQGILGDVHQSTVTQEMRMEIRQNDFDSLKSYLKSIGLMDEDILDLKHAIESQEKPVSAENLGPKVSPWIGKMITKAASGSWKIAAGTAAGLLTRAIASHYGLP